MSRDTCIGVHQHFDAQWWLVSTQAPPGDERNDGARVVQICNECPGVEIAQAVMGSSALGTRLHPNTLVDGYIILA